MKKIGLVASIALVAGCSQNQSVIDKSACRPLTKNVSEAVYQGENPLIGRFDTENCIHEYAYRFAKADGSIGEIAKAVVGACYYHISAHSERTGMDKSAFEYRAYQRVVEARLGDCEVPGSEKRKSENK